MSEDLKWAFGLMLTLIFGVAGYARHISTSIKTGDDVLHHRINEVRDDYVKRDDFDAHLARSESRMRELRDELRADFREFRADLKNELVNTRVELKEMSARLDMALTKTPDR